MFHRRRPSSRWNPRHRTGGKALSSSSKFGIDRTITLLPEYFDPDETQFVEQYQQEPSPSAASSQVFDKPVCDTAIGDQTTQSSDTKYSDNESKAEGSYQNTSEQWKGKGKLQISENRLQSLINESLYLNHTADEPRKIDFWITGASYSPVTTEFYPYADQYGFDLIPTESSGEIKKPSERPLTKFQAVTEFDELNPPIFSSEKDRFMKHMSLVSGRICNPNIDVSKEYEEHIKEDGFDSILYKDKGEKQWTVLVIDTNTLIVPVRLDDSEAGGS